MKVFAPVFFFLALALVSEAVVDDKSILEEFSECTSSLRAKIQGEATAATVTQARADCRASCINGADAFKRKRCPELCGLGGSMSFGAQPSTCILCFPNKNTWIRNCRALVDIGVNNCVADCGTTAPDASGPDFTVRGTSGAFQTRFPSNINP